jgi:hypothetical protein
MRIQTARQILEFWNPLGSPLTNFLELEIWATLIMAEVRRVLRTGHRVPRFRFLVRPPDYKFGRPALPVLVLHDGERAATKKAAA